MNIRHLISSLSVLEIVFKKYVLGDIALKYLEPGIHEVMPKVWHGYIGRFCFTRLPGIAEGFVRVPASLSAFVVSSDNFKLVAARRAVSSVPDRRLAARPGRRLSPHRRFLRMQHTQPAKVVNFPMAKILMRYQQYGDFVRYFPISGWKISVQETRFWLNVSVARFDLPSGLNLVCLKNRHVSFGKMKFCGKHFGFFVYLPVTGILFIKINCFDCRFLLLEASYSVFDRDVIKSVPVKTSSAVNLVRSLQFGNISLIHIYSIVVEKIYFLSLSVGCKKSFRFTCKAFDGPDLYSSPLTVRDKFVSSSFQCTLYFEIPTGVHIANQVSDIVKFSKIKLRGIKTLHLSSTTKGTFQSFFFQENGGASPFSMHIAAEPGRRINMSVSALRFGGDEVPLCNFGGVSFLEEVYGKLNERSLICFAVDHASNLNIVSETSTMTFVAYWYKPYNISKLSIFLVETECDSIWIDPCALSVECAFARKHKGTCSSYLHQISRTKNVHLTISDFSEVIYRVTSEGCTVIQVSQSKNISYLKVSDHCKFKLTMDAHVQPKREIHQHIQGNLPNSSRMLDKIEILGVVDRLCFHRENESSDCFGLMWIEHDIFAKDQSLCRVRTQKNKTCGRFSLSTINQAPVRHGEFNIPLLLFSGATKSWISLQIRMSGRTSQTESLYLTHQIANWQEIQFELLRDVSPETMLKLQVDDKNGTAAAGSVSLWSQTFPPVDLFKIPGGVVLKLTLKFSRLKPWHWISLPGVLTDLNVGLYIGGPINKYHDGHKRETTGSVTWIDDVYTEFPVPRRTPPECSHLPAMLVKFSSCVNFSSMTPELYLAESYFILFHNSKKVSTSQARPDHRSWRGASQLCRAAGGSLLTISTKDEQDLFVALLKLSTEVFLSEAYYLGLRLLSSNQVRILHLDVYVCVVFPLVHCRSHKGPERLPSERSSATFWFFLFVFFLRCVVSGQL